jgi:hypothetical protein
VIPAGTGQRFTGIEDHLDDIRARIDQDKVTPLKSEAKIAGIFVQAGTARQ